MPLLHLYSSSDFKVNDAGDGFLVVAAPVNASFILRRAGAGPVADAADVLAPEGTH